MPQPLTIRAPVSRPTSPQLNPGAAAGFGEQRRDPPDAEDAVHVIPDGAAQHGGVDAAVHGDGVVGQVVNNLELLVQQLPHVGVQPVDEGEAVVLPGVILKGESAGQTVTPPSLSATSAAALAPARSQPSAMPHVWGEQDSPEHGRWGAPARRAA